MEIIKNEQEMLNYGKKIARQLTGGDILCLSGELGSGKTTLTKGLVLGLGIKDTVLSPTFTLINLLKIKNPKSKIKQVAHIDTYRLKKEKELIDIGVEDYLGAADTICVIEWPEKIKGLLKNKKIKKIRLEHVTGEKRKIIISP